jgi:maleate isomerase
MTGWRARIGILFPGNSLVDDELWQWVPEGVSIHINRLESIETLKIPYTPAVAQERSQSRDLEAAARNLRIVAPTSIAYACTSGSFVGGLGHDRAIIERLSRVVEAPVTTTSTAMVMALREMGIERVAVAAPYLDELSELLRAFLEASGFKVSDVRALNLGREFGTVPASEAYRLARRADGPGADGVFIACTALPTLPVIEHLEADLGKPVITANQATMWEALRLSGVATTSMTGRGSLYRRPPGPQAGREMPR